MEITERHLKAALEELPTERLSALVNSLEREPDLRVTVGAWRPHCPMVLAGFDPTANPDDMAPERRFAATWDRFASRERRPWWLPVFRLGAGSASRPEVQALLRRACQVLAERTDGGAPVSPSAPVRRVAGR